MLLKSACYSITLFCMLLYSHIGRFILNVTLLCKLILYVVGESLWEKKYYDQQMNGCFMKHTKVSRMISTYQHIKCCIILAK